MYAGCKGGGPEANGWLLAGLPFAFVAGIAAQAFVLRMFPPKLAPHAEGSNLAETHLVASDNCCEIAITLKIPGHTVGRRINGASLCNRLLTSA